MSFIDVQLILTKFLHHKHDLCQEFRVLKKLIEFEVIIVGYYSYCVQGNKFECVTIILGVEFNRTKDICHKLSTNYIILHSSIFIRNTLDSFNGINMYCIAFFINIDVLINISSFHINTVGADFDLIILGHTPPIKLSAQCRFHKYPF